MSDSKTVLITGGTGYLGGRLAYALVNSGYTVAILKRQTSSMERLSSILDQILCFNIEDGIERPFQELHHIESVVHIATSYGRNGETPWQVFQANVVFALQLLETATSFNASSFLNTDTYFNTDTLSQKYLNNYSLTKSQFLQWGRLYGILEKIRFINIRLEHVFGPRDHTEKFTTQTINNCLLNIPEYHLTQGEQKRDFIYIQDVISAYMLIIKKQSTINKKFIQFGVGSGTSISIRNFVEMVHRLTHSQTKLRFGTLPYRENEIMNSVADTTTLRAMGWHPRFTLEHAIRETIAQERK